MTLFFNINSSYADRTHCFMSSETEPKPKKHATPSEIPFSNPEILARYVTDTGKILPRRITGLSAKEQRRVTKTIKRARNMLLMK